MSTPDNGRSTIIAAARWLAAPGGVVELRALNAVLRGERRTGTVSGYFDSPGKLADAAAQIVSATGVYITLNEVNPDLLARAANRLRLAGSGDTTSDGDVLRRRWLLVDLDPKRPAKISSTDAEHAAALERAERVRGFLQGRGWPEPIVADSGNGAHLLYRIDLPVDDGGLVKRCLLALVAEFDDGVVTIDLEMHTPARIVRLYGTMACKGDDIPNRPHRQARLVEVPAALEVVTESLLRDLTGPEPVHRPARNGNARGAFDLDGFIARHLAGASGPKPWNGGEVWHLAACPFGEHSDGARVGRRSDGAIWAGCHHESCSWNWHDLRAKLEPRPAAPLSRTRTAPPLAFDGVPVVVRLSDVKPEPVAWLWPGRFALGKLILIAGDPGLGKSFLTLDMASRVSTGAGWPDRPGERIDPGGVVLLSAEDGVADTIRPRLDAAGADVSRIVALEAIRSVGDNGRESVRTFDLAGDLPALEAAIRSVEGCRLVVIDPVTAYLGGVDSHKNAEIRGLLAPLAELAARQRVAVVAVTHLNKSGGGPAIYRAMGSLAFAAAARAAWAVSKDKDDPRRRLLLPIKNNIAPDTGGLAYRIEPLGVDGCPVVAWEPDAVNVSADDALAGGWGEGGGRTERDDAADWLRALLAHGPRPACDVEREARDAGYSIATVRRAKAAIGVVSRKPAFGGAWQWTLPAEDAHPPKMLTEAAHTPASEHLGTDPAKTDGFHPKVLTCGGASALADAERLGNAAPDAGDGWGEL